MNGKAIFLNCFKLGVFICIFSFLQILFSRSFIFHSLLHLFVKHKIVFPHSHVLSPVFISKLSELSSALDPYPFVTIVNLSK
jgi:hypothetical protein